MSGREIPIFDFDDPAQKAHAVRYIKALRGKHTFDVKPCRAGRSLSQNALMWGVVLPAIARGIAECWGERVTPEKAHEFCKRRFLSEPVTNHETGEVMGSTSGSTATLEVGEFSEYLDQLIKFGAEYLGLNIQAEINAYCLAEVA